MKNTVTSTVVAALVLTIGANAGMTGDVKNDIACLDYARKHQAVRPDTITKVTQKGDAKIDIEQTARWGNKKVSTLDLSKIKTDLGKTNATNISCLNSARKLQAHRPDTITSTNVNGSTLNVTQTARWGDKKTTAIDMSGLTTNQGNGNAKGVMENQVDISRNSQEIVKNTVTINEHTEAIKGLDADVRNNSRMAVENAQTISQHTKSINENSDGVAANATGVAINSDGVATNAKGVATNKTDIATNTQGVATNAKGVATNAAGIACNSQRIGVNTHNIAVNSGRITVNSKHIQRNWESIQFNAGNIDTLFAENDVQDMQINYLSDQLGELQDYTNDVASGLTALSSVDFTNTTPGKYQVAGGIGAASKVGSGLGFAGAVGIQYQSTESTAFNMKGWAAKGGNYGIALGVSYTF